VVEVAQRGRSRDSNRVVMKLEAIFRIECSRFK
jgi:hypothetical protein